MGNKPGHSFSVMLTHISMAGKMGMKQDGILRAIHSNGNAMKGFQGKTIRYAAVLFYRMEEGIAGGRASHEKKFRLTVNERGQGVALFSSPAT